MYTAKITNKEEVPQGLLITVEFSDGVKSLTETCIPQSEDGFKYWVKSRLSDLNSIEVLDTAYTVNDTVDVSEPEEPTKTQAELEEEQWFKDYASWLNVKNNLVDTGVVNVTHPKVQALLSKVQTNLKASYVDKF